MQKSPDSKHAKSLRCYNIVSGVNKTPDPFWRAGDGAWHDSGMSKRSSSSKLWRVAGGLRAGPHRAATPEPDAHRVREPNLARAHPCRSNSSGSPPHRIPPRRKGVLPMIGFPSNLTIHLAENAIRPIQLGAENWMFFGSKGAGHAGPAPPPLRTDPRGRSQGTWLAARRRKMREVPPWVMWARTWRCRPSGLVSASMRTRSP
jgi:hypothetical protein